MSKIKRKKAVKTVKAKQPSSAKPKGRFVAAATKKKTTTGNKSGSNKKIKKTTTKKAPIKAAKEKKEKALNQEENSELSYHVKYLRDEFNSRMKKDHKYSLRQFAKDIGDEIDHSQLSRILNGMRRLTAEKAMRILAKLKVNKVEHKKIMDSIQGEILASRVITSDGKPLEGSLKSIKEMQQQAATEKKELLLKNIDVQTRIIERIGIGYVNKKKMYIVSAVMPGAEVHLPFFAALSKFRERYDAKFVFVPGGEHKKALQQDELPILESTLEVIGEENLFGTFVVTRKCLVSNEPIQPQKSEPLSGLEHIGLYQYEKLGTDSFCDVIFPVPRLDHTPLPTGNASIPREFFCSGTICTQNYRDTTMGRKGYTRHKIGATIVLVDAKGRHEIFSIEASRDGSFNYRGTRYLPDKTYHQEKAALVKLPDGHFGWHNQDALDFFLKDIKTVGTQKVTVEDSWDNTFNSHHQKNDSMQRIDRPPHLKTLFRELCVFVRTTRYITSRLGDNVELFNIWANHNAHLITYLQDGMRWTEDETNKELSCILATAFYTYRINPLAYGAELILTGIDPKNLDKVLWAPEKLTESEIQDIIRRGISPKEYYFKKTNFLGSEWINYSLNEDYYLDDAITNIALHGHIGVSGAKGNSKTFSKYLGKGANGHCHFSSRIDSWSTVGTMTDTLGYAKGLSRWTKDILYFFTDGSRQRRRFMGYEIDIQPVKD
jgi:hypothetical protein